MATWRLLSSSRKSGLSRTRELLGDMGGGGGGFLQEACPEVYTSRVNHTMAVDLLVNCLNNERSERLYTDLVALLLYPLWFVIHDAIYVYCDYT